MVVCFPSIIHRTNLNLTEDERVTVSKKLENIEQELVNFENPWIDHVKNSMGKVQPHLTTEFLTINTAIIKEVRRLCDILRVRKSLQPTPAQSWINFYQKYSYQESHYHPNFTFSAVYYHTVTEDTKIIFENPTIDMLPLEVDCQIDLNQNYLTIFPKQGDILIFRSYLRHQVPMQQSDNLKISFAYNFKLEN
jgi:uncharacterized protein (TIGR02466 family)